MCWDAETSFASLGVGTVVNAACFTLLRRWESTALVYVVLWQYALLMQIPEGIAWLQLKGGETNIREASRAAFFLNVTQPLILFACVHLGEEATMRYGHVAAFLYVVTIATQMDEVWPLSDSIAPEEGCPHLDLAYWNVSRGVMYVVASLLILSEARPVFWAAVNASIFSATLLLALVIYPCGAGSLWCWLVVAASPILVGFDRAQSELEKRRRRAARPPAPPAIRAHTRAVHVSRRWRGK